MGVLSLINTKMLKLRVVDKTQKSKVPTNKSKPLDGELVFIQESIGEFNNNIVFHTSPKGKQ